MELINICRSKTVTLDLIKYMVEKGADIKHKNWSECTSLLFLCMNSSVTLDLIEYMVENGADFNYENIWKETSLTHLCNKSDIDLEKKLEIIRCMKKYIIDIDEEIEKIKNHRYIENKEEIIEELERVESTTKSAAKR
jgi:ankyrin repeat protein